VTTTYDLYLDHGPKRRKTTAHVPQLMGCMLLAPTTDEAIEGAPDEIRTYLRFLLQHGERVDPDAPFGVRVVEEVTEGAFVGNGAAQFSIDRKPLRRAEIEPLLDRYRWIREATVDALDGLTSAKLDRKPAQGRALSRIVEHIVGSEASYISSAFGADRELNAVWHRLEKGQADPREALVEAGGLVEADFRAASPSQLKANVPHGERFGSARRTMRRSLEHGWEHFREIGRRLDAQV
jgi:hypothetical protein